MKFFIFLFLFLFLSGCVKPSGTVPPSAPESFVGEEKTDFLIYEGPGAWPAELSSIKKILYANHATYESLSPDELNKLSVQDLRRYRSILFAGGNALTVRKYLNHNTRSNIKDAIQLEGLNYIGFCAGAWLVVSPETHAGEVATYGLDIFTGPPLALTSLHKQGLAHALDEAIFPNGTRRKLLWYGGPITLNLERGVIAKYSDGTPAISQLRSGKGLVIMSGLHPAATKSILTSLNLYEQEAISPDLAWTLLDATRSGTPLPTF